MSRTKGTTTFEDELEDTPRTVTIAVAEEVSQRTATTTNPTTTNLPSLDGDEFEFGDEEYLSKTKLPRIRNGKGEVIRFFLTTGIKPRAKETHYLAGSGTFQCLKPSLCPICLSGEVSRTRIVALAIKYANADGKTAKLGNLKPVYEVGYVSLSRANYTQMTSILEEGSTVYDVDFKMASAPRAFGFEFSIAASQAAYKKVNDEAIIAELVAPYLDGIDLAKKLGKKANAGEMKTALNGGVTADTAASLDIEDLDKL
jgi:hypothetical protein